MKLFIKLRKKYFTILASLALLVLSSIGLFNLSTPSSVDASMIKFDNENTITITNGSFSSFSSSSSYPYTISGFTTSGNKTPEMKTGAINISESEYVKNYEKYGLKEYDNPKGVGSDNYVLMINADKTSNYTYTSSEFTLPANGYYYVTVSAKTIGDNAIASVFLTQNDVIFKDCIIQNIDSTTWSNYTFFVATNSYEDVKLKFNMQIGNQSTGANGCVVFDELHAGAISLDTINGYFENPNISENSYRAVDLRTANYYKQYEFDNQVIEFTPNGDDPIVNTVSENYFADVTSGAGEKQVDITNNSINISGTDTYITYKGKEEVLDANSTYRFSIWAKTTTMEQGSASVELNEIIDENDEYKDFMESTSVDMTPKSSSLMISNITTNTLTNVYVEYVIYVRTGALGSSKVQFSFGLGTEDENATGNVSFKRYMIERVPYSAYSAVSTSDTKGTIDISSRLTLSSNEFSNYTFDKMQSESFDGVAYPANPDSWTKTSAGQGTQLAGVVNLSDFDKVMDKYSHINTMDTPAALGNTLNNNVLMIYNGTNSTQSYKSSTKSLTANKYYKVTAFVNTYISGNSDFGASIVAKSNGTLLGTADNINTYGAWQKVEFYINTPSNAVDLTLELALGYGNKMACGYAFFDNILVEESETENEFSNRFNSYLVNQKVELDLTNPMLISVNRGDEYNTSALYSGTNKGETVVNAGIVDLTGSLNMVSATTRESLKDVNWTNKYALAIATALDVDSHYEYASVINYSFNSGTYYKMSFDLFTDGIGQQQKDEMYDNNVLAQGVNIELTNLENAKFSYITSNGNWTHYEIYIGVDSNVTSNLKFSLGSEFSGCYGRAFLGNIELTEVDENIFKETSASANVLKVETAKTDDNNEDKTTKSSGNNFNWQYVPTIATFAAIVIAVVGIFIRRNMKFKKRVKTGRPEYDRDITVMQNKYRRLAQDQRAKDVRELTKECEELVALRTEYENKYKDALSRLRSAKLANRDGSKRHEVMAIEHEVKHISKEVARFGVQVNNYQNEIEFMQTEAYLIDLEKRIMREDNSSRNQLRREAEMTEEARAEAVAKRNAKQQRAELKAQVKADKLANKKLKLEEARKQVEQQLSDAKALDEKYVKEQELKQIKLAEIKLAKEQAKAQKELEKLEKQRETETKKVEEEKSEQQDLEQNQEVVEETTEQSSDSMVKQVAEEVAEQPAEVEVEQSSEVETKSTEDTQEKDIPSDN